MQPDGKIVVVGNEGVAFTVARYKTDGTLDNAFDGDGKRKTGFALHYGSNAHGVAIQSDGKIVVVGQVSPPPASTTPDFLALRLYPDGSLDNSFNGAGYVMTPVGAGADYGTSVAIQTDGKIVAAGYSVFPGPDSYNFVVVRYNLNGSLDTAFNGTGKTTVNVGN